MWMNLPNPKIRTSFNCSIVERDGNLPVGGGGLN